MEAVDPGREMVEIARRRVGAAPVRFHVGRFEDVELPECGFGAVFSATAFHWVDPAVGSSEAGRCCVQAASSRCSPISAGRSELDAEFLAAWREVLPEAARWSSRDERTLWEGAEARRGNVSELWALARPAGARQRPEAAELFGDARVSSVQIKSGASRSGDVLP